MSGYKAAKDFAIDAVAGGAAIAIAAPLVGAQIPAQVLSIETAKFGAVAVVSIAIAENVVDRLKGMGYL